MSSILLRTANHEWKQEVVFSLTGKVAQGECEEQGSSPEDNQCGWV